MSKVVFVGNVPYDMEEEQLTPIFSTVGPIAGFRLMVDKETKKSKGYAFCEYYDHETAASAVRNLNGTEVAGRPLRIDLADSDPFLEGKTTTRGEFVGLDRDRRNEPRDILANLPPGVPVPPGSNPLDVISKSLANIRPPQMIEILGQMKAYIMSSPDQARALLTAHPQLGYAFFQAMVMHNIVDPSVLQRMLGSIPIANPPPVAPHVPATAPPPPTGPMGYRQPPPQAPPQAAYAPPPPQARPPPTGPAYGNAIPPVAPRPPPSAAPPSQAAIQAATADFPEDQRAMLLQILSLTAEQVSALPPSERATVQQLRAQFGAMTM